MTDTPLERIESLPANYPKPKLSAAAINILLSKGYSQSDIARYFSVSAQAVSDYIRRHAAEIIPLKDFDEMMLERLKTKTLRAISTLDDEMMKKGGIIGINAFVGTGIEKIRLIEGKSTQNVSIVVYDMEDLQKPNEINEIGDNEDVKPMTGEGKD